jgi:NAD(P)-dependent dehydrogenase (short-subunit alcohol dehydrogenase family)
MNIRNKVAVVTGATGGIGFATASALIERAVAGIAIVDLSNQCEETAEELNSQSGAEIALPFCGDVTNPEFRRKVFDSMDEAFGAVQICVPAAGIIADSLAVGVNRNSNQVELYDENIFRDVLNVNLVHPTYWAMETIAGIARQRIRNGLKKWAPEEEIQGVVIFIGSVSCRGNRGQVGYAAAKSALNAVSATLNLEGLFHGVQCKIVHPGFVNTQMVDVIDQDYFEKNLKPLIGLGRKIRPGEIAAIICAMIENPVLSGEVWADASMRPLA